MSSPPQLGKKIKAFQERWELLCPSPSPGMKRQPAHRIHLPAPIHPQHFEFAVPWSQVSKSAARGLSPTPEAPSPPVDLNPETALAKRPKNNPPRDANRSCQEQEGKDAQAQNFPP